MARQTKNSTSCGKNLKGGQAPLGLEEVPPSALDKMVN